MPPIYFQIIPYILLSSNMPKNIQHRTFLQFFFMHTHLHKKYIMILCFSIISGYLFMPAGRLYCAFLSQYSYRTLYIKDTKDYCDIEEDTWYYGIILDEGGTIFSAEKLLLLVENMVLTYTGSAIIQKKSIPSNTQAKPIQRLEYDITKMLGKEKKIPTIAPSPLYYVAITPQLHAQSISNFKNIGVDEQCMLKWLGMIIKIKARNIDINNTDRYRIKKQKLIKILTFPFGQQLLTIDYNSFYINDIFSWVTAYTQKKTSRGPAYFQLQYNLDQYLNKGSQEICNQRTAHLFQTIRHMLRNSYTIDHVSNFFPTIIGAIFIAESLRYLPSYVGALMLFDLLEHRSNAKKWHNVFTHTKKNTAFQTYKENYMRKHASRKNTHDLMHEIIKEIEKDARHPLASKDMFGNALFFQYIDGYSHSANKLSAGIKPHENLLIEPLNRREVLKHPSKQKFSRIIIEWLHLAFHKMGLSSLRLSQNIPLCNSLHFSGLPSDTFIYKLLQARISSVAPLDDIVQDIKCKKYICSTHYL